MAEINVAVTQSVSIVSALCDCKEKKAGFSQGVARMTDGIKVRGGICSVCQRTSLFFTC